MNTTYLRKFLSAVIPLTALVLTMPCLAANTFPSGHFVRGKASLSFDGDGKFSVSMGNDAAVEGGYSGTAEQVTFTDKSGKEACAEPGQESGTYHWTYAHDALTFGKIEDRCDARAHDLTNGPWQRTK